MKKAVLTVLVLAMTAVTVPAQNEDQIVTTYQDALKLNPDDTDIRYKLAALFFERGQLNDAAGQFAAIVRFDPDDAAAHYNLGLIHYKQNDVAGALGHFRTALDLTPKDDNLYYVMGMCYLAQQDYPHAIEMMEMAVSLNSGNHDARINLANAYANAASYKKAVGLYETILDRAGEDPLVQKNLGSALYNIGLDHFIKEEYAEALDYLVRSLPYVESKFKAHLLAANSHFNLGRYHAAADEYRKVLVIDRDDPDAQYYLAYCYLRQDSLDLALEHFGEVLRIRPDHSKALKYKAELLDNLFNRYLEKVILAYKAADYITAWKTIKLAEKLVPDNPNTKKYRDLIAGKITGVVTRLETEAAALAGSGDYAGSYREYRTLLELEPERPGLAGKAAAVAAQLDVKLEPRYRQALADLEAGKYHAAWTALVEISSQKDDFKDVRDRITFSRSRLDDETRRLEGKAVAAFKREDYRAAVRQYDAVLAVNPGFKDEAGRMAEARRKLAREDAARKEEISRLMKEGESLFGKKRYGQARARFASVVGLDAAHTRAQEFLDRCDQAVRTQVADLLASGKKLYAAGSYATAQKKFARLLELHPDHAEGKGLFSVCRARQLAREGEKLAAARKYIAALKKIRSAMKLDEGNQYVLGVYRKTVAARKKDVASMLAQGKTLLDAGRLSEAEKVLSAIGAGYQANHRESRDLLKKIKGLRNKTDNQAAVDEYYSRGVDHYTRGEYKKAVEMWNRVLELRPAHQKARRNIENARKKLEYLDD